MFVFVAITVVNIDLFLEKLANFIDYLSDLRITRRWEFLGQSGASINQLSAIREIKIVFCCHVTITNKLG